MKKGIYIFYVIIFAGIYIISQDLDFSKFFSLEIVDQVVLSINNYEIILLITFNIILCLSYLLIRKAKKNNLDSNISFGELFLLTFGIYYTNMGFLNAVFARAFTKLPLAIDLALENNIYSLIAFSVVYLLLYYAFPKAKSPKVKISEINYSKLSVIIVITSLLATISIIYFWSIYGSIPVFSGFGVSNVNMDISEKVPILVKYFSNFFSVYALYIGYVYLFNMKKSVMVYISLALLLLALFLTGIRLPLVLSFVPAVIFASKQIKTKMKNYWKQISFGLLILFVLLGVWRNRVNDRISVSAITIIAGQMGVEFSEYSRLLAVLNKPVYKPSMEAANELLVDNIIITSLPNIIWNVLGVEKSNYDKLTYITFGKLIYRSTWTGIRPGTFGEVYYGFGQMGVIIWGIIIAVILCPFDIQRNLLNKLTENSFYSLIICFWGSIISVTAFMQFNSSIPFFTASFLMFYCLLVFSKRKVA